MSGSESSQGAAPSGAAEQNTSDASVGLGEKVAAVLSARLVVTSVDALTVIALVRFLARTELAVLSLVFVLYELVRQVAALGLPESVFFFLEREGPARRRAVVRSTLGLLTIMGVVSAVTLLAFQLVVPYAFASWTPASRAELARFLPVMALVGLFELPSTATYNTLVALDRPRLAGAFNVSSSVVTFAALLLPAVLGLGLSAIRIGFVAQAAFRALASIAMLRAALPATGEATPPGFVREQLGFAGPLGLHALVGRLHRHLDKWIVATLLGETATAAYAVATTEIPFVTALPYAVGAVFVSRYVGFATRSEDGELLALFHRGVRKISLAVIPITTFVVVFAEDLVRVAFGPGYPDVVWPFRIVALITLQRVAQYGVVLQAYGRTRQIVTITAVMLCANALLAVPLASTFGLIGAASANLIASYLGVTLYLVAIARSVRIPFAQVLPFARLARSALVTFGIGFAVLLLARTFAGIPAAVRLVSEAVVFAGACLVVGLATGAVQRRDLASLRLLFGRARPKRSEEHVLVDS